MEGRRRTLRGSRPEQGVGGRSVRFGLAAMRCNPRNLSLEQGNPLAQFFLRIGIETFLRQQAGVILTQTRAVIIVHAGQESTGIALLSTVPAARSPTVTARQQGPGR